jgi:nitrite reductase/ring-hydroxylating ferredoxin subunit
MPHIAAATLTEKAFLTVDVLLNNKSTRPIRANVLVIRFGGQVYAYVNHCMHMHRPLNCQRNDFFDKEKRWLRCSMHGFIFEPETGVCISPVCAGQALQAIKIVELDGMIVFKEKHISVLALHPVIPAETL